MPPNKNRAKPRRVRASVLRRTVVGSLVVMLSPFLTVLEHDADAAVRHRSPIIYNSAPARPLDGETSIRLMPVPSDDADQVIASIRNDIRAAVTQTWSHD